VILDDVGVDQLPLYGNGGDNPPSTPSIDTAGCPEGVDFWEYFPYSSYTTHTVAVRQILNSPNNLPEQGQNYD
jgi:hypothetical protein